MTNDTEHLRNIFTNLNDNEGKYTKPTRHLNLSEAVVDRIADSLVEKLQNPESRAYYCKIARKIPSTTLERLAVKALEQGDHPARFFTFLAQRELERLGVIRDE